MSMKIRKQEVEHRRWFKQLFRSCPHPYCDVAEFKDQLERSEWCVTVRDHPFMQQTTEEEQRKDINKYIKYDDAVTKMSKMMDWNEEQTERYRTRQNDTLLRLFYRCPSTTVLTSELIHNMKHCTHGAQAPGTELNPIPERESLPSIFNTRLFVRTDPGEIAWPQLRKYIADFYMFCELVQHTDDLFFRLQTHKTDEYLADDYHLNHDHQDYHESVKFESFLREFGEKVCAPLNVIDEGGDKFSIDTANSNEFWSTKTGCAWFHRFQKDIHSETDKVDLIHWKDVYQGLLGVFPSVPLSLDEIFKRFSENYKPAQKPSMLPMPIGMLVGGTMIKISDTDQTVPAPKDNDDDELERTDDEPKGKSNWSAYFYKSNKNKSSSSTTTKTDESEQADVKQSRPASTSNHHHAPLFSKVYKTRSRAPMKETTL